MMMILFLIVLLSFSSRRRWYRPMYRPMWFGPSYFGRRPPMGGGRGPHNMGGPHGPHGPHGGRF
mgnify:CR=1 FL=1